MKLYRIQPRKKQGFTVLCRKFGDEDFGDILFKTNSFHGLFSKIFFKQHQFMTSCLYFILYALYGNCRKWFFCCN